MTAMPSTNAASLPSLRLLAPSARPSTANTKHATGTENFLWISMIGLCGEMPCALQLRGARLQLLDAQLALAARRAGAREHALGIERHDRADRTSGPRRRSDPRAWCCGACRPRAPSGCVRASRSTTMRPRLARKITGVDGFEVSAASTSSQPWPFGRDLAHVEDDVGEVFEEDARPDFAFGAVHRRSRC